MKEAADSKDVPKFFFLALATCLALALGSSMMARAAENPAYQFRLVAALGDPLPAGSEFDFDFEPGAINNQGDIVFVADILNVGEGLFIGAADQRGVSLTEVFRANEPAPGGGTFGGFGAIGPASINDRGDYVVPFTRLEGGFPLGFGAGIFRSTADGLAALFDDGDPAPGGGTFRGAIKRAGISNGGDISFIALVTGYDIATGAPGIDDPAHPLAALKLGTGVFTANKRGISLVAKPGDAAPGGGMFDYFEDSALNNRGDVAFGAHIASDECITVGATQEQRIFCATSVFLKATKGAIRTLARQGEPAPGGGIYRLAFGPLINSRGDVAFLGDLTPAPDFGTSLAVFLHRRGVTVPVARPGDAMPGGGRLVTASFNVIDIGLNDRGDVAFSGILDSADSDDGFPDSGLFVRSHLGHRLVARSGTEIPGVGTVLRVGFPLGPIVSASTPFSGAAINNAGQILFQATVRDGDRERGVLLLATPRAD